MAGVTTVLNPAYGNGFWLQQRCSELDRISEFGPVVIQTGLNPNQMHFEPDWTGFMYLNRIGPDRIGLGFEPDWTELVFLREFEGAEPSHTLAGGCVGRAAPPTLELAIASERASSR